MPELIDSSQMNVVAGFPNSATTTETDVSERSRRDSRALITSIAGISYRMVDAGLKLLIIPLATRLLGIEEYGVWLTANALLSLLMVSDFGIGSGVVNAVSGALARGDVAGARSFLATAYVAFGVLAIYVAGAVTWIARSALLPRWLGIQGHPRLIGDSRQLFVVMGLLIATAAFLNVINFFVSSLQEGYLAHCAQIAASVAALVSILNLHTRSMSHFAVATALPIVIAYVGLSIYIFGIRHAGLRPAFAHVNMASFKIIWRDGSRLLIAQVADTVVAFTSSVLVASHLGAPHVPEVSVSLQVMMIVSYVACMFIFPLWPAYVEAVERRDYRWVASAFRQGALRSLGCVGVATITYALIYKQFIHRWSSMLPIPSRIFVVVLGAWFIIYVWNKNALVLLNALGLTEVRAWVAPIAACSFVSSAWLLLPHIGILAIPVGGVISALLEASVTTTRSLMLLSSHKHSSVAAEGPECALMETNYPPASRKWMLQKHAHGWWCMMHGAINTNSQLPLRRRICLSVSSQTGIHLQIDHCGPPG